MTAKDIMRPVGFVLKDSDDAYEAARRLFEAGQAGAVVLEEDGRLAGVVSQSDIASFLRENSRVASDFYSEPDRDPLPARPAAKVGRLMSRVIVQVPEDMPLDDVERHMLRRRVSRVLVVRDGKALGIISATDIIRAR